MLDFRAPIHKTPESTRLSSLSGYGDIPVLQNYLAVPRIPNFDLYCGRMVELRDLRQTRIVAEVWSPNAQQSAFYPGPKVPGYPVAPVPNVLFPTPARRRADGHFGRFDGSCHPQLYSSQFPYLPFCPAPPSSLEQSNFLWRPLALNWIADEGGMGIVEPAFITGLLKALAVLDDRQGSWTFHLRFAASMTRPSVPSSADISAYAVRMNYFQALDGISCIQRQLCFYSGWIHHEEAWNGVPFVGLPAARLSDESDPAIPTASARYMGVWGNGLDLDDFEWYARVGRVPIYLIGCYSPGSRPVVGNNELLAETLYDRTSVEQLHGADTKAISMVIQMGGSLVSSGVQRAGMDVNGWPTPTKGSPLSRDQGYLGPRTIPSSWRHVRVVRPHFSSQSSAIDPIHSERGFIICTPTGRGFGKYSIRGAPSRPSSDIVAVRPPSSDATTADVWGSDRSYGASTFDTHNWSVAVRGPAAGGGTFSHSSSQGQAAPLTFRGGYIPAPLPHYQPRAPKKSDDPSLSYMEPLTRVSIDPGLVEWVKPPLIQEKQSSKTKSWSRWLLCYNQCQDDEESYKVGAGGWAFWSKAKDSKLVKISPSRTVYYDRAKCRILLFPLDNGHLAFPDGLHRKPQDAVKHWGAPVPQYHFVQWDSLGRLNFHRHSHWMYPDPEPGPKMGLTEPPRPNPTDLPIQNNSVRMHTEWVAPDDPVDMQSDDDGDMDDDDDDDDSGHRSGLPRGRPISNSNDEDLPRYQPPPPSFWEAVGPIVLPSRTEPVPPVSLSSVTVSSRDRAMEEAVDATGPSGDQGVEQDIQMEEVITDAGDRSLEPDIEMEQAIKPLRLDQLLTAEALSSLDEPESSNNQGKGNPKATEEEECDDAVSLGPDTDTQDAPSMFMDVDRPLLTVKTDAMSVDEPAFSESQVPAENHPDASSNANLVREVLLITDNEDLARDLLLIRDNEDLICEVLLIRDNEHLVRKEYVAIQAVIPHEDQIQPPSAGPVVAGSKLNADIGPTANHQTAPVPGSSNETRRQTATKDVMVPDPSPATPGLLIPHTNSERALKRPGVEFVPPEYGRTVDPRVLRHGTNPQPPVKKANKSAQNEKMRNRRAVNTALYVLKQVGIEVPDDIHFHTVDELLEWQAKDIAQKNDAGSSDSLEDRTKTAQADLMVRMAAVPVRDRAGVHHQRGEVPLTNPPDPSPDSRPPRSLQARLPNDEDEDEESITDPDAKKDDA
ncbi:hypothetical protein C8J56DRAFT_1050781 [Mycena floridula]|nr:hypothetical protein C8J56DRAFT_1050781 [Mycena floridula]